MNENLSPLETIGRYGGLIDSKADAFLARNSYDMYGMMRYFMGFTNEAFEVWPHKTGKRLRPGLMLYLADCFGQKEATMPAALSLELFHNFTLIHDDIVDRDELRHGRPTVWKIWGKDHALNTGDGQLILSILALRESNTLSPEQLLRVEECLLSIYLEVVEGQYLDFTLADLALTDARVTERLYLEMINKKTAVLIAAAAKPVGIIAKQSEKEIEALYEFGINLGMGYQLYDDLQSLWGSAEQTGKVAAGDIRERKKTLPILYARDHLSAVDSEEFIKLYMSSDSSNKVIAKILALIEKVPAREYANMQIAEYKKLAIIALQATALKPEQKETLSAFVEEVMPTV